MEPYEKESILMDEIGKIIDYVATENKLTYSQVIGVLELLKDEYIRQGKREIFDEDE